LAKCTRLAVIKVQVVTSVANDVATALSLEVVRDVTIFDFVLV